MTTTQLWGYVLFLRMFCIKHNFGMKKGRSTRKTDRSRAGKAPGRPVYTPWAGRTRPLWPPLWLQKFREPLRRFAYLCFIKSVLWKGSEKEKENSRERKKEKKVCEEKNKWRDSMVREVQRDITLLFENNILNSNHVQSDNEDDACALKSIFLYAFAHVHHSKSSYPWTPYIMEKLSWSLARKVSNH